jgi:hypothetical protein
MCHSAKKLGKGQDFKFPVHLTSATQSIVCYVMCDEIGRLVTTPYTSL